MSKTYVYDNIEVTPTGRVAERTLRSKVEILVEVKPTDPENGSWCRWARKQELYEIKKINSQEDIQKNDFNEQS